MVVSRTDTHTPVTKRHPYTHPSSREPICPKLSPPPRSPPDMSSPTCHRRHRDMFIADMSSIDSWDGRRYPCPGSQCSSTTLPQFPGASACHPLCSAPPLPTRRYAAHLCTHLQPQVRPASSCSPSCTRECAAELMFYVKLMFLLCQYYQSGLRRQQILS